MYFEIYKDAKGEYRWHLKAANHEIIAQGPRLHQQAKLPARSRFGENTTAVTPVKEV
ncbi:phage protein [Neisseria mucosa]|nr:phage protein [Neisseria mucosa]